MKRKIRFLTEWRQFGKGQVTDAVDYGVADALVNRRVAEWAEDAPERQPTRVTRRGRKVKS